MVEKGLQARDKLIIVLVNILLLVSIEKGNYMMLSAFAVLSLAVVVLFRPDYRRLPGRVALVFLYPLMVSVFIPFANDGNVLAGFSLGPFLLTVTDNGLTTFFTVLIKSFLSVLMVSSLVLSTDENELFHGLRRMKVPAVLVSIIFLMYRYVFLIKEESRIGRMAINSHVFKKSYHIVNRKLAFLMGNMLIKSFDRAENIYRSMESRGFTGQFHIYGNEAAAGGGGVAILVMFTIIPASLKILELARVI